MKKLLALILLAAATTVYAEIVQLSGVTPTQREDNSALGLSEIAGFNIYCGDVQGNYPDTIFIPGATLPDTVWELDSPIGTRYCVVTTVDVDNRESAPSNEVTVVIEGKSRPNPPMIPAGQIIRKVITLE
jgi:hypothetical protein